MTINTQNNNNTAPSNSFHLMIIIVSISNYFNTTIEIITIINDEFTTIERTLDRTYTHKILFIPFGMNKIDR